VPRPFRMVPVSAVLLSWSLGFLLLLAGGCGGDQSTGANLSPENKKNVEDELKAAEEQQKAKPKFGSP